MPTPPSGSGSGSSGSKLPISVGISLDKKIACCPGNAPCAVGEACRKIIATGTAKRGDAIATDVQVTVTGPGGAMKVGNGTANLEYDIREEDCGETIKFEASGADKKAEDTAEIIKIEFNGMGDPHRVGINGKIDRTQKLTASVSPKKYAADAVVTVGQFLTLKLAVKLPDTGLVKFDIVGEKPGSKDPGDTFVKIVVKDCIAIRKVSVVIPKKIAEPHKGLEVDFATAARWIAANTTTVPPVIAVKPPNVLCTLTVSAPQIIGVWDQFNLGCGDLYAGSEITEFDSKINSQLKADSTYSDMVGFAGSGPPLAQGPMNQNSPFVQQWLNQPQILPQNSPKGPENCSALAVEVDGFSLDQPAIAGRLWKVVNVGGVWKFIIIWP